MQANQQMTLKEWIITLILLHLPIAGLVMLIIWATDKEDRRNTFAKAYLIVAAGVFAIIIIIYVLIFIFFFVISLFFTSTLQ